MTRVNYDLISLESIHNLRLESQKVVGNMRKSLICSKVILLTGDDISLGCGLFCFLS